MDHQPPTHPSSPVGENIRARKGIQPLFTRLGSWIKRTARGLLPGPHAFRGATLGLAVVAALFAAGFLVSFFLVSVPNWPVVGIFLVLFALLVALANLLRDVLRGLARLVLALPRPFLWALLAALLLGLINTIGFDDLILWLVVLTLIVTGALLGAGLNSLVRTGWRDLAGLQRGAALGGLVIGGAGALGLAFFLAFPGARIAAPANAFTGATSVAPLNLPDPSLPGTFPVETFTYGSGTDRLRPEYGAGADFTTPTVDGSKFIGNWSGLTEALRNLYWGFNETQLPLNGQVWAPAGDGPFPLVLIVHGNHAAEDFSEGGYAYLGELFASRGFITVSVDENFLNTADSDVIFGPGGALKQENDARGWLLLEHLRQWREWNADSGHPFYRRVDLDRVALIGHSRGGEAVAIAAAFNRLPAYPDDASVPFDYGFGIRSVIAIAPVDGQYRPASRGTPLENVNYFSIQGSHDADMRSFHGALQYERVRFTDGEPWFKALLYVYGANHGQFNSRWARYDYGEIAARLLNVRNLIPAEEQAQIARVYFSAFLEATLHGQDGYRALFENHLAGRDWLPDTIYLNRYAGAGERPIANFEEDLDVRTAALPGSIWEGADLAGWREQMVKIKWGTLESQAVYLSWDEQKANPAYALRLGVGALEIAPQDALVFSLADSGEKTGKDEQRQLIDLTVELVDRAGQRAALPLSHVVALQPQLEAQVTKLPFTNPTPPSEAVFQSYRFALVDFQAQNPAFDPQALAEIRFVFDRSPKGAVILDDLGLR